MSSSNFNIVVECRKIDCEKKLSKILYFMNLLCTLYNEKNEEVVVWRNDRHKRVPIHYPTSNGSSQWQTTDTDSEVPFKIIFLDTYTSKIGLQIIIIICTTRVSQKKNIVGMWQILLSSYAKIKFKCGDFST